MLHSVQPILLCSRADFAKPRPSHLTYSMLFHSRPVWQTSASKSSCLTCSMLSQVYQRWAQSLSCLKHAACCFRCISSEHNLHRALYMQHAVSGVSVEGTIITTRDQANQGFYGRALTGKQLLLGGIVSQPTAAKALYAALHELMDRVEEPVSVAASTR